MTIKVEIDGLSSRKEPTALTAADRMLFEKIATKSARSTASNKAEQRIKSAVKTPWSDFAGHYVSAKRPKERRKQEVARDWAAERIELWGSLLCPESFEIGKTREDRIREAFDSVVIGLKLAIDWVSAARSNLLRARAANLSLVPPDVIDKMERRITASSVNLEKLP